MNWTFDLFYTFPSPLQERLVFGGSIDVVRQYISLCCMVSISCGLGRFVLMVMVVEKGDTAGAFGLFQILVSYSNFCYIVLCVR